MPSFYDIPCPEQYTARSSEEQMYFDYGIPEIVAGIRRGTLDVGVTHIDNTPDSRVFRVERDGYSGILRLSTPTQLRDDDNTSLEAVGCRIRALRTGRGLDGYEQLLAYSLEDEAVLTLPAAGALIHDLPPSIVRNITTDHLWQLATIILPNGAKRGLVPDETSGNVFYHPSIGFTLIDYSLSDDPQHLIPSRQFAGIVENAASLPFGSSRELQYAWLEVIDNMLEVFVQAYGGDPYAASRYFETTHRRLKNLHRLRHNYPP